MPDNSPADPWDSLADELGARPAADSPQPARTPPPPPRQREHERPPVAKRPPTPASSDWDSLADNLGIPPGPPEEAAIVRRVPEQARPRPEPPAPRYEAAERRFDDLPASAGRGGRRDEERPPRRQIDEPTDDGPAQAERSERGARGEGRGESRDEQRGDGEGRGRRRRGRRGGRGRRRDDDRPAPRLAGDREASGLESGGADDRDERDERFDDERRTDADRDDRGARDDRGPRRSHEGRPRGRGRVEEQGREVRRPAAADDFSGDESPDPAPPAFDDLDEPGSAAERRSDGDAGERGDDRLPRKRRRRGRRGGRSRSRGESAETSGAPRGPADDGDDEPLPASYGSRPSARPEPADRGEESQRSDGDRDRGETAGGEPGTRSRGRRRRRRGEGSRSAAEPRKTPSSERRESTRSRSGDGRRGRAESRGSSRGRGRRDDFAPVSSRFDEDDEGLEFLGVEEAVRDAAPRPRPAEDDDVLAESGLSSVLDVPSWVEAIGIVIAGNLTARTSRGGRSDGGSPRGR